MELTYAITPEVQLVKTRTQPVVFPNGKVDIPRLTQEVGASSGITVALATAWIAGDYCTLAFKGDLPPEMVAIVDAVVSRHSGEPLPVGPQPVQVFADKVTPQPVAADGKPFMLPNIFPGEVLLNFAGCDDADEARFEGKLFGLQQTGQGDTAQVLSFDDGVFLAGGHIEWDGGAWGSYVYMELNAPPSSVKSPAVAGRGNCNVAPTPYGFNIIVPAAGDGQYDLDNVVPIPANDTESNAQNGYWNYSEPWVGQGRVTPSPTTGKYNLFDAPLPLAHFAKLHLFRDSGSRDLIAPAIKPKWILPEWKIEVSIHNEANDNAKVLRVTWDLMIARRRST